MADLDLHSHRYNTNYTFAQEQIINYPLLYTIIIIFSILITIMITVFFFVIYKINPFLRCQRKEPIIKMGEFSHSLDEEELIKLKELESD